MRQNISFRHQIMMYFIAAVAITLDQYTKYVVRNELTYGETVVVHPVLRNIFDLTYTTNTGASFGILQNGSAVLTSIAIVVLGAIVYLNWTVPAEHLWLRAALGIQMGGVAGNLFDRLRFGMVTDFLHVHYWPIFNVADSCITVGTIIMIIIMFREMRGDSKSRNVESMV